MPSWKPATRRTRSSIGLPGTPNEPCEHGALFDRIDARLYRMTDGASCIRNEVAKARTLREAREIASEMGLTFVRTLTPSDLAAMAGNTLDRDLGRSVRRADLVTEATDSIDTR